VGDVITHKVDGEDIAYRICRCFKCGIEHACTPSFDFYTRPGRTELYCEPCLLQVAKSEHERESK
jgi:hypothetical protein